MSSIVHAQHSVKLADALIQVQEKSDANWQQAVNKAWYEVLIRITGDRYLQKQPYFPEISDKAQQYIEAFHYQPCSPTNTHSCLAIRFNLTGIKSLCRDQGMSFWAYPRPNVLTWIFIKHNHKLIPLNESRPLLTTYQNIGYQRGIKFMLPMLDLTDTEAIAHNGSFTLNPTTIYKASNRYKINNILIATLNPELNEAHWTFYSQENSYSWDSEAENTKNLLAEGLHHIADDFAAKYALNINNNADQITLAISNINTVNDLSQLTQYLTNFSSLSDIELTGIKNHTALIQAKRQTSSDDFDLQINQDAYLSHNTESNIPLNTISLMWHPPRKYRE